MQFKKLVSPSLTDLFVKEILHNILSGKLAIGEKLPNERELAKMMNVSRAVINRGIMQLSRMGFVEVAARKGVFVGNYMQKGTITSLQAIIEYNGGRVDTVMLDSIYEVRNNEESHIACLAAKRHTEKDILDLRAQLQKLQDTEEEPQKLAEITFNLYHLLAIASGNVIYPMLLNNNKVIYIPLLRAVYKKVSKLTRFEKLKHLIDLVEEKKSAEAAAYIVEISNWSRRILETCYKSGDAYWFGKGESVI